MSAFVSISPVRGTMELVWGCVFTIIICTWNLQHLTIPSPNKSAWRVMGNKVLWAFLTMIAPEFVCMLSFDEHYFARTQTRKMQDHGFPWWTTKHSFFGMMGGYLLEYQNKGKIIVGAAEIRWLASSSLLVLPEVTCREIDGLAREKTFQKAIAAVQLVWFALQCIGRAVERMELALFEVTTLCFVTYAVVTLICWWKKPSGVSLRRTISCPSISVQDIDRMLDSTKGDRRLLMQKLHIRQFNVASDHLTYFWFFILWLLAGGIGAWHLSAWNYSFPTSAESTLWRVSSIVATIGPTILLFLVITDNRVLDWVLSLLIAVYVAARLFLLVETIISLRSAPAGIYQRVRWSDAIPHF
ncbi:uncharacterized protein Z520_01755 [Fonsecaea multimorphosa CBS 102226]|uniref:Uncharacterized protein n=1 Tax=Fonsecaea multimorphosa CBS 102226 TaxID=1442371 RepID=A0A0D2KB81_9EURO|nr:uncharacterized protein Z520_01755 [Fonsecaea multimorphosa CBS 102226]KIY03288.1 hypothetical protein Z520_01755 [Fonsecaea multimorphosa CBS 102226]OAL30206.1 hypothetical protein AYO22_01722 [Fonsecaea multimorphosa]